ncbi:chondroadherin [Kryptolebias marmoratus]|uniref:Chondroadherin n=1 Tax=Kryptolebias marmoratus TaxID=37003 RepID=A0A3Q2ZT08_KRYMA|nr:chondroadherin [Kryptolebias marmoratus]
MCCVSWVLLGTFLVVLAVQGAPSRCPSACQCRSDLQHIMCDDAGLRTIPRVSEEARLVSLQRNNLGSVPTAAFSDSKKLVSLHMQDSQLQEIESQAFKGLKQLAYLYLSNNRISSIKPGAFDDLTHLTYLYLDGNQISKLAKGIFSPMINLFFLQLNANKLQELRPGTFTGARDLRWLHMSGNKLSTLHPGSLDEVENLALLHLSDNKLSAYPSAAMSKLRVLEELRLGGNAMRTVPDNAFQSFGRYLEKLHLDSMGLEKLSDGAFNGVRGVRFLQLDNNNLKSLPKNLKLQNVTNMVLNNNPWDCTCVLAPLRRWMDSNQIRSDAVCASPASQRGKQIRDSTSVLRRCRSKPKSKIKTERRH